MHTLNFKFVNDFTDAEKAILRPSQKSEDASGFDLASSHRNDLLLNPNERLLVNTGIALALPSGFEGQIRTRSGIALKFGVVVLNSPGTIDADYRGEIKIILANLSTEPFTISFGMRIAQLVIAEVVQPTLQEVKDLDQSERGENGFGSTGLST